MRATLLLCLFLNTFLFYGQHDFYDPARIQNIEIFFKEQDWDKKLDVLKHQGEEYLCGSVKLNGSFYDSVGVKYKGNSSYDSTYKKNPFHIELNAFRDQEYKGVTDIKLSNGYADPSMVREALGYRILENYMPCPRSNFARVSVNGIFIGLYTSSESVNKDFCERHFFSETGILVKGNPGLTPSPNVKSNLRYIGADSNAYKNYYELKSPGGWAALAGLCDTLSNRPESMHTIMNVDQALWMLAFNNAAVNLDSYSGVFAQNYYLYKDYSGLYNPIVWDLNMCFGGFPFLGSSNSSLGSLSISGMKNMPVSIHSADAHWPLIKAVHGNPLYRKMYIAHLRTLVEEQFSNGKYLEVYNELKSRIQTPAAEDQNKFYSDQQFQNALNADVAVGSYSVPGIENLIEGRLAYYNSRPEFTTERPELTNLKAEAIGSKILNITVDVKGASKVYLYYRYDRMATFTSKEIPVNVPADVLNTQVSIQATLQVPANLVQYYFFAEGTDAGRFLPARSAHEYFSHDLSAQITGYSMDPSFYPNPASEKLTIRSKDGILTGYSLLNLQGAVIMTGQTTTEMQLDLSEQKPGMYILEVNGQKSKILLNP